MLRMQTALICRPPPPPPPPRHRTASDARSVPISPWYPAVAWAVTVAALATTGVAYVLAATAAWYAACALLQAALASRPGMPPSAEAATRDCAEDRALSRCRATEGDSV